MSIKSLLQVILVLLIVIIIGGIYYLYFYSKPLSPVSNNQKTLVNIENSKDKTNLIDEVEMLDNQVQKKIRLMLQLPIQKKQKSIKLIRKN